MLQPEELGRLCEAHTWLPIQRSIHWAEHFYSNTFQLLMRMLMLNFPESPRQARLLFSVLDENFKSPTSPGHKARTLLLKSGLPLMNSFAELHAALAWELVFSQTETLCIYFLIPEKLTSAHISKTCYFAVLRWITTILETLCSHWKGISWLRRGRNRACGSSQRQSSQ